MTDEHLTPSQGSQTFSAAEVEQALDNMRTMLEVDGYELQVDVNQGRIELTVVATAGACPDCLAPKPVLSALAESILQQGSVPISAAQIDLRYPVDHA